MGVEKEQMCGTAYAVTQRIATLSVAQEQGKMLRMQKMHALIDEWEAEIALHAVGCLELHFGEQQVKAVLRVSLGQKKR